MTELLYLKDFTTLTCEATVVEVLNEEGRDVVVLDHTVFYPQGGGQPYDKGAITSDSANFTVDEVRFFDGIVRHIGSFVSGAFRAGDKVICNVEAERRALHSRLHSAGHVVDMAVRQLGLTWVPGKGYHFPDGAYVEYEGSLEGLDKEKILADIEAACNAFVQAGAATKVLFMERDEMAAVCHFVPDALPAGKPGRVVMFGDFGVPCGGTHVADLKDIGRMTIRKIKAKGPNVQIGYDVTR